MGQRVISTRITLDGEREFKDQMAGVNRELRNLGSEMKLAEEKFRGQEKSVEALTEKDRILRREIEQQQEKVRALSQAVVDASEAYGKTDRRTDDFRQSLNRAQADLIRMQRELRDTEKALDGVGDEAIDTGDDLAGLGGKGLGGIKDLVGSLGKLKGAVAGGVVALGLDKLKDAVFEIVDGTAEYRKIMGTLEISSLQAGYAAEETEEAYNKLYGVLGDTQSAATTLANLQSIGLEQQDLLKVIDQTVGAWGRYGDSIPIDGLAEAINETIRAGKVTGNFADVLNWGVGENESFGLSLKENIEFTELSSKELKKLTDTQREEYEATKQQYESIEDYNKELMEAVAAEDKFNIALAECETQAERTQLVMDTLTKMGLTEAGQAWRDVNEDIVKANEAQARWDAQMGRLGAALSPAKNALISFGADALEYVIGLIDAITPMLQGMAEVAGVVWDTLTGKDKDTPKQVGQRTAPGISGSHAGGLERVPYDGYLAEVHKDEAILTAAEADLWRAMAANGSRTSAAAAIPDAVRHDHTGTIRVEGVNDAGQLQSVVEIIVEELRQEARR